MAVAFVYITFFLKTVLIKKLTLSIISAASTGSQGTYVKYVRFPWPLVVSAHNRQRKYRFLWQPIRLKGRCLNVFKYIKHSLFSPMASPTWHFLDPLHLTTSLLQLLKGTDKNDRLITSNILYLEVISILKYINTYLYIWYFTICTANYFQW